MSEYHVGCGAFGIYAGRINKKGDKWLSKSNVTDEAVNAVAQYLLQEDKLLKFQYKGHAYQLLVLLADSEGEEGEE